VPDLVPYGDEPSAGPWHPQSWERLARELGGGTPTGRPVVVAVDGHSGSGKTTVAERLAEQVPGAVVVHTDDVAWWESFLDWDHLMAGGILEPARRGEPVGFRPPAWDARGREGAIEVPAGRRLVVVEGVGSSRRSLTPLVDAAVWVQSDYDEANRRGIARDGGTAEAEAFWWEWMAAENPFLLQDRPWERAAAVVCGTPSRVPVGHDARTHVLRGRSLAP
jgi:hypothetical protein